jgi:hypothetical protein
VLAGDYILAISSRLLAQTGDPEVKKKFISSAAMQYVCEAHKDLTRIKKYINNNYAYK